MRSEGPVAEERDQASGQASERSDPEGTTGAESEQGPDAWEPSGTEAAEDDESSEHPRDSWAPWGAFSELQEAVGGIVDNALRNVAQGAGRFPRYDLFELRGEGYRVLLDLPGLEKGDVDVSISGRELTISGERGRPTLPEGAEAHRSERTYGRFRRSLTIPGDVDGARISAKMTNGVLEVHLALRDATESQRIQVD